MTVWEIDWRAPYAAFAPLSGEPHAHLLHGGDRSTSAEWSIIAAFPSERFEISPAAGDGDPFLQLQERVRERSVSAERERRRMPFRSGFIGFAGYEAAQFVEPVLSLPSSPYDFPTIAFCAYDAAALFSRRARCAYVVGRDERACRRLRGALGKSPVAPPPPPPALGPLASNVSRREYETAVGAAIEDILDGVYYQANISHQISATADDAICAFDLFRRLAGRSDAEYGALLQFPDGAVLSNSPERFFRIDLKDSNQRRIVAEPIKGTRPRGRTRDEDERFAQELLRDPKDRAENVMIADLMRNDLSKICREGSIREDAICELVQLSSVHHLVSRISGELHDGVSISDVFSALFPCGSVTGAPKVEAMNAIARTERIGRGPYCGAIGYVDDRGTADFAVAIRTMMITRKMRRLTIPVGGGVTIKSDPSKEYQETLAKAREALEAIGKSQQEL